MEIRYRLSEPEWLGLERRFEEMNRRAAIVGLHGRGKTTLLEDFATRLGLRGWRIEWIRLSSEAPCLGVLPPLDSRTILVCDGAEQLSWHAWLRFRRAASQAGGTVITTHRAGRLPTLYRCETTPALLRQIATSLDSSVSGERCDSLFTVFDGNVREAIRALYDDWSVS